MLLRLSDHADGSVLQSYLNLAFVAGATGDECLNLAAVPDTVHGQGLGRRLVSIEEVRRQHKSDRRPDK